MEGTTTTKKPTSYEGSGIGILNFVQKVFYIVAVISIIAMFINYYEAGTALYSSDKKEYIALAFTFLGIGVSSLISGLLMTSVKTIVKAAHIYVTEHEIK